MPAAPSAPPPTAPAQPAPSAPPPAPASKPAAPTKPASPAKSIKAVPPPSQAKELFEAKPEQPKQDEDPFKDAFADIDKLAGKEVADPMDEETPSVENKEEQPAPDKEPPKEPDDKQDEIDDEEEAPPTPTGKRPSPWKLVESYKSKYQAAQHEIAELRNKTPEPPKELSDRLSAIQKRNEELEQHIRFVDYSKSQEFVDKYQKPYEEAWTRAVTGLKGLKVQFTDPATSEVVARDMTPQDIAALAAMEPAAARMEIKNRFPEDAAEVRGYVDRIRDLSEAQSRALETEKTKGGEWQKQQAEQMKAVHEANGKLWMQFNKEAAEKHEFLRPVEGDDERNTKLDKATAFVQRALSSNANDPKLTEEQRAQVIKEHVAVRNRAIAYSVLMHENKALKAQLAEREAALKAFEDSGPTDGNGKGKQPGNTGDVTIDSIEEMIGKLGR